jgi:hypothetical protein
MPSPPGAQTLFCTTVTACAPGGEGIFPCNMRVLPAYLTGIVASPHYLRNRNTDELH